MIHILLYENTRTAIAVDSHPKSINFYHSMNSRSPLEEVDKVTKTNCWSVFGPNSSIPTCVSFKFFLFILRAGSVSEDIFSSLRSLDDCTSRLNLGCSIFLCQTFYRSSESFDVKVPITLSILGYLTFGADSIVILF